MASSSISNLSNVTRSVGSGPTTASKPRSESTIALPKRKSVGTGEKKKKRKEYYKLPRFDSHAKPVDPSKNVKVVHWRMDDRMKTVAVGLVCCLNIGVDPPDVVKVSPCARMECWIDPSTDTPQKSLDLIGKQLQTQYERWQPRARYKILPDPTVDEVKKLCLSLRRVAKRERILFHYNGHGVPKPTNNGEIWMFNKSYTQYIPLSIYELQSWMGSPSIYVFDCSAAGVIINWFQQFAEQREKEEQAATKASSPTNPSSSSSSSTTSSSTTTSSSSSSSSSASASGTNASSGEHASPSRAMKGYILLAACGANETLPSNPSFPADLFTSCLLTPVKTALRWFCSSNPLLGGLSLGLADEIPGKLNDRRTPLGEINWIFTAITDTIAWNVLPPHLFQKLYRQDLLVASLFRNFLLAERIMKSVGCNPISYPKLPSTHQHPMWDSWDLTVESFLYHMIAFKSVPKPLHPKADPSAPNAHLPHSLSAVATTTTSSSSSSSSSSSAASHPLSVSSTPTGPSAAQQHHGDEPHPDSTIPSSFFFTDQLTAFEVWLEFATEFHRPPEQLPIVLQVLLSQAHRHRALLLLARFLDLGSWATNLALSVGIFPYVLKLLQSPAQDLRLILVFIWAKILALDRSCQTDLVKDQEPPYFLAIFGSRASADLRTLAAFVLSVIMDRHPRGQAVCLKNGLLQSCLAQLNDPDPLLRRWVILCLGKLWEDNEDARWAGVRESAHERLCGLLTDPVPEVRAAVVFALGTFIQTNHAKLQGEADDHPHPNLSPLQHGQQHPQQHHHQHQGALSPAKLGPSSSASQLLHPGGLVASSSPDLGSGFSPPMSPHQRQHRGRGNSGKELRINIEMNLGVTLPVVTEDASPMVRKELICALTRLVDSYADRFKEVAFDWWQDELRQLDMQATASRDFAGAYQPGSSPSSAGMYRPQQSSVYACLWKVVMSLRSDPVPEVGLLADTIVRRIFKAIGAHPPPRTLIPPSLTPTRFDPDSDFDHHPAVSESPPVERTSRLTSLLARTTSSRDARNQRPTKNTSSPRVHADAPSANPEVADLGSDLLKEEEEGAIAIPSHLYEWSCEYFSRPLNLFTPAKMTSLQQPEMTFTSSSSSSSVSSSSSSSSSASGPSAASDASVPDAHGLTQATTADSSSSLDVLARPSSFEQLDVSSVEYALLVRRQRRNNRVITEAFSIGQKTKNSPPKLDFPIAILDNATAISRKIIFHPFEPLLISVNEQNAIGVWNWEEGQNFTVSNFSNMNVPGTRVTSLTLMNEQYDALLASGSNEGTVRIWKNFTGADGPPKLLTAWRALTDFYPTSRGSGLIFDWNSDYGVLAVSGDLNVIRLWDVDRELCTSDLQTFCDSCVTCLSNDRISNRMLLAGFGNGKFRTFDTRAANRQTAGIVFPDFDTWVVNAQALASEHQVVAGSTSGSIKIFDLRQNSCALVQSVDRRGEKISALVAHQYAPVIASGSSSQRISFFNYKGEEISQIKYHEGFLGQRIGPVSCLAFHPYLLYLAAGATDHIISVYSQNL